MLVSKKIVRHELVGLNAEIIDAKNPSLIGIKGEIIDETKNTIIIKHNGIKKIIKDQVKMKLKFNNQAIILEGKELVGRPEERIKK